MTALTWQRKLWLAAGGLLVVLLAAAVFTLGSLNVPVHPRGSSSILVFFAVTTFLVIALLIFGLILTRTLLKLWAARRAGQLGSRFQTKMVFGAMGVSLLPVVFLFFFSYALINRTLNLWFPKPLETANEQSQQLLNRLAQFEFRRLSDLASSLASQSKKEPDLRATAIQEGADVAWTREALSSAENAGVMLRKAEPDTDGSLNDYPPRLLRTLNTGLEIYRVDGKLYSVAHARRDSSDDVLYVGHRLPGDFLVSLETIEAQRDIYGQQRQSLRAYKNEILLGLLLITLLLLFSTTWVALFLSRQVTGPIQALAEATQEVAHGNLAHRVRVQAQDELGTLVTSFNQMTAQLDEGRRQINEFTRSLQQAIEERERRGQLMEAVLENIPAGVLSLDAEGNIARPNSAVTQIFGEHARDSRTLTDLLGDEAARQVHHLMRGSLRMGAASREIEIAAGGRLRRTAFTVSSLGPRRSNPGFVVVIDDLTELLRAQKAAAWQEVAQRIAHEIKNPLTPIQLSAQRLLRHLERSAAAQASGCQTELNTLVAECASLIEREVQTLEALVDAFSQFARFPTARLAPIDLNTVAAGALEVFRGRLEGIAVQTDLAPCLPQVRGDAELLRRVVVNLIDNAAEAMESSTLRRLQIATRLEADGDAVQVEISDTGQGISLEDKEKMFLPHFSTKERGTGLGLAIASRIVAEHHGTIQVLDNLPCGARFLVRIPAMEAPAPSTAATGASSTA